MILLPGIEALETLRIRYLIAKELVLCGIQASELRASFQTWNSAIGTKIKQVSISFPSPDANERVRFTGMSSDSLIAAKKAVSEYLEALAYYETRRPVAESRSGWASAESFSLAVQRAYQELIERDAFIMHFLCPELATRKICGSWDRQGILVTELQTVDPKIRVCLAGKKKGGHWILGLGASDTIKTATEKAVLETEMLARDWSPLDPARENQGDDLTRADLLDRHWKAAASSDVNERLQRIFQSDGHEINRYQLNPESSEIAHEKKFSSRHFPVKRVTVKLTHPEVLPLKFGQLWMNSEQNILTKLQKRGLKPRSFVLHPLL